MVLPLLLTHLSAYGVGFTVGKLYYYSESTSEPYCASVSVDSDFKETIESIVIPESITYSGITYTVTQIRNEGFSRCPRLERVDIPKSVTEIGEESWLYSPSLKKINVNPGNPKYSSVDGIVYDKDLTVLLSAPGGITSAVIPETVTKIGNRAFSQCENLESVCLPSSLKEIGTDAFEFCKSLREIDIPASVNYIGDFAFFGCESLQRVSLPEMLEKISDRCFMNCRSLESVEIPERVREIEFDAFSFCDRLKRVSIPSTTEIIEVGTFNGCPELSDLIVDEGNPSYCSIDGMLLSKDRKYLVSFPSAKNFVVPEYVDTLGYLSLAYSNVSSVTLLPSLKVVCASAFLNCLKLRSVSCYSLIPPEVIGYRLLTDDGIEPLNCIVYVPAEAYDLYKTANGWKDTYLEPVKNLAVEEILAEGTHSQIWVYTLDGTLILTTTEREQIRSLPKGIYIVRSGDKTEKTAI